MEAVQAGRGSWRRKTQNIIVRYIIRQRNQARLDVLGVLEAVEFATGELRQRLSGVRAQTVSSGEKGHGGQSKRRSKLADAVEYLLAVMTVILRVGLRTTETPMRWP